MNEQPEPCPKCSSNITSIQTRPGESRAYVECANCGCRGPSPSRNDTRSFDVAAIDEWNVYARARRWADTSQQPWNAPRSATAIAVEFPVGTARN